MTVSMEATIVFGAAVVALYCDYGLGIIYIIPTYCEMLVNYFSSNFN